LPSSSLFANARVVDEYNKGIEKSFKIFYNTKMDNGKNKPNIGGFEKQLEECQKKKDEYLAGWQRERADFLNYKKEEIERIGEILKYAGEGLILKILPILDNFDLIARQNFLSENLSGQEKERIDKIIQGFVQIKIQFQDFLKNLGVEEIKSVGDKFDPNFQEVIEEIKTKDKESGIVIEEIQKGYKLHGKVLRPAKVKIVK